MSSAVMDDSTSDELEDLRMMKSELMQRYKEIVATDSAVIRQRCAHDAQELEHKIKDDEMLATAEAQLEQTMSEAQSIETESVELEANLRNLVTERSDLFARMRAIGSHGSTNNNETQAKVTQQRKVNEGLRNELLALGQVEIELRTQAAQCVVRLSEEREHLVHLCMR